MRTGAYSQTETLWFLIMTNVYAFVLPGNVQTTETTSVLPNNAGQHKVSRFCLPLLLPLNLQLRYSDDSDVITGVIC